MKIRSATTTLQKFVRIKMQIYLETPADVEREEHEGHTEDVADPADDILKADGEEDAPDAVLAPVLNPQRCKTCRAEKGRAKESKKLSKERRIYPLPEQGPLAWASTHESPQLYTRRVENRVISSYSTLEVAVSYVFKAELGTSATSSSNSLLSE
jgi:hypothetical protein